MKKPVTSMMKVNRRIGYLIIGFLTICILESKGQSACTQTLRQARTVFDEGRIHELENLLSGCIKNGFNDEERTEAYRLLILSYIYLDETDKADAAMLDLLQDNHGFEISEQADPTELIHLYKTYRTEPIFFWGGKVGANTTFVNVQKTYGVSNENDSQGTYTNLYGFEGSLIFEKKLLKRITARADMTYAINSFFYTKEYFSSSEGPLVKHESTEKQTSLGLSLMAQFRIFNSETKWNPYVGLGVTAKYLLASTLAADTQRKDGSTANGANEDLIDLGFRKKLNPSADIEIGIKPKAKLNYYFISLRYSYGLSNITNKHYDNGRLSTFYGWAANDINTHSAVISLGLLIPNYSPKKLTK
jgi:hypothetical protein